jgi:two-component system, cell cycle response regulator
MMPKLEGGPIVPHDNKYLVDVIGFTPTERTMLTSIFALAARRDPGFAQYDPLSDQLADLYLVDMDDAMALAEFRTLNRHDNLPAVVVASPGQGGAHADLERPLQWARLLQAMEKVISEGELAADDAMTGPMHVLAAGACSPDSHPGAPVPTQRPAGGGLDSSSGLKRALGDTVLVVDDNATVRAFMQAKLAPFSFEVDFAETGEQAIALTGSREYACVFLDVVMPGVDGYTVCKLIKTNKQAIRKTAVVMLTSRSSPFDKLRGSLAGCDEYLTKPLDEDRLLEVFSRFLPSSRKRPGDSKHG